MGVFHVDIRNQRDHLDVREKNSSKSIQNNPSKKENRKSLRFQYLRSKMGVLKFNFWGFSLLWGVSDVDIRNQRDNFSQRQLFQPNPR